MKFIYSSEQYDDDEEYGNEKYEYENDDDEEQMYAISTKVYEQEYRSTSQINEDSVLDYTDSMKTNHMEDSNKEYDWSRYWGMLSGEIERNQDIFFKHTYFEERKNKELEVPAKPKEINPIKGTNKDTSPMQAQPKTNPET